MRVSSNSHLLIGTYALEQQQYRLDQVQQQLSTMKRVNNPSDDPVASAQILTTTQNQGISAQFTTNAQTVQDRLALEDSVLKSAGDLVANMKTLAIQAGNGTMTQSDLQSIQSQFRQQVQDLVGLANSTDNSGNYIFSGTKTNLLPYSLNMTNGISVQYQGDAGRAEVQVSASRTLAVTDPGSDVFGSTSTPPATVYLPSPPAAANTPDPNATSKGNELWQAISRFDQILSNPSSTNPSFSTSLAAVISGLDAGMQNVLTANARVGARENEASQLQDLGASQKVQYSVIISHLQDLDVPKAVSDFQAALQALQATQKTYQQVSSLSLFQYIQ